MLRLTGHLPRKLSPECFPRERARDRPRPQATDRREDRALLHAALGRGPPVRGPVPRGSQQGVRRARRSHARDRLRRTRRVHPIPRAMCELILASPGRAFDRFDIFPFCRGLHRQHVLHKSNDQIAELNGWKFHPGRHPLEQRAGRSSGCSASEPAPGVRVINPS